jgi:hypothetical protein
MSRTTHYIGLSERATEFLALIRAEIIFEFVGCSGMFDEPIYFKMYNSPNPEVYIEVLQECPWSGGPCIFTCLVNSATGKRVFEWSEEEIYKIA